MQQCGENPKQPHVADREQERGRLGWFLAAKNESEHDRKQARVANLDPVVGLSLIHI